MKYNYQDIENTLSKIELLGTRQGLKMEDTVTFYKDGYEKAVQKNPLYQIEFWAGLSALVQAVREILKTYKNPETKKLEIKWYHFLLKKELRNVIFQLITFVIGFIKGID